MPIYEYLCRSCMKEIQCLILKREERPMCPSCGGRDLKRLLSRVSYHASEADRLAGFDPGKPQDDGFYRDSRNIGLHAKKRAAQMGVDLGSAFETKLDRLRSDPGSVLRDGA